MTTFAVLLRGVNVGGNRKVAMKQWKARLEELGCTDVVTHLQSGQAVVRTRKGATALGRLVADDLRTGMGVDTSVQVRTHAQLQAVVDGCPWPDVAAEDPSRVHALFVTARPTKGWFLTEPDRYDPERAEVGDGVVYLLFPNGAGRARMPAGSLDGTARNWRTVRKLLELTAP